MLTAITFPALVALSVVLLVVYIGAQGHLATKELGTDWNVGPRDDAAPSGKLAGRADRALRNFQETYPAYLGLALALAIADPQSALGKIGALLWLAARIVYLPLYIKGVPYFRTLVWMAALVGLVLMLVAVFF